MSKHSCGLSLLPHPVQMEDISLIREDSLQRVIGLLRASFTHLVLDLSKSFSATDVAALHTADVILLVAQLELSSLRNVVRMLQTLGNDETLGDKVKVVLNRVGGETRHHPEEGRGDHRQADLLAVARRRQADDGVAQPGRAAAAARPEEQAATELRRPGPGAMRQGNRGPGQGEGGAVGYVCTAMKSIVLASRERKRARVPRLSQPCHDRARGW